MMDDEAKKIVGPYVTANKKAMGSIEKSGGFFYFLSDAKGENAAVAMSSKDMDANGGKAYRIGRGALAAFKKKYSKALFSQGEVRKVGGSLTLMIGKGNAKPAIMKAAFKKSPLLQFSVGKLAQKLKTAKIVVGIPDEGNLPTPENAPRAETGPEAEARQQALKAWAESPENVKMKADLEMSDEEMADLFDAEKAFEEKRKVMPKSEEEETELQELQAETDANLDELAQGEDAKARYLAAGNEAGATAIEKDMNNLRIKMAQKNPIGPDKFGDNTIDEVDRQALNAAIRSGLRLYAEELKEIRSKIPSASELEQASPEEQRKADETLKDCDEKLFVIKIQLKKFMGVDALVKQAKKKLLQSVDEAQKALEVSGNAIQHTKAEEVVQKLRLNGTIRLGHTEAKAFPGWKTFKKRATDPKIGGMNEGTALAMWVHTVQILRLGTHLLDESDPDKDKLAEYEATARAALGPMITTQMEKRFPRGKKYAFWSGMETVARAYASKEGYQALETSALGEMFNGLEFYSGKQFPGAWNVICTLWKELSRAYAENVRNEVHIFARWSGPIFKNVERPALNVESITLKWHALVPKLTVKPIEDGKFKGEPACEGPEHVEDLTPEGCDEATWLNKINEGIARWKDHYKDDLKRIKGEA